jgi:hypothetical protein
MLYPIFLRVFPSKLDAEQIGGGRGECSAARARMENESTTKTADPESGRPGNRAPQASAASARAPHGSRTAPPQLPRDPATSVLHAFTHQSVGEYCGEVGLYSGDLALLVPAPSVGEYCGDVGEYDGEVGEYWGEVGEY